MGKKSRKEKNRPAMPEETKRQVLVEAGHRCSVARCSSDAAVEIHHIDYDPSNHDPANLLVMCPNHHTQATNRRIDRLACLMYKQQLSMKDASKTELEEMLDEKIEEMRRLVGSQETPKPLEDKDRGTQRPNGRIEAAAEQVRTFVKADIEMPVDVLRSLAESFYESGELNAALEIMRIVAKSDGVTATDHSNVGLLLHKTARREEAEASYRLALDRDPTDADVWNNLGLVLWDTGRGEEAEKAYRTALELDPRDAYAWTNLGNLLFRTGQREGAEKAYRTVLDLDPKYALAWNNLGALLEETGRQEEAERGFRKAIELDAQLARAWSNLGRLLEKLDRKEEAAEARQKAIEAGAHGADGHSGLAYMLWECGRYDDAELEVMEALKDDPNHAYAHATLGLLRFEQDKLDEGRQGYEKAMECNPDDLPLQQKYHYEYGRALARNKQPKEARAEFDAALQVNADYISKDQIETELAKLA